MIITFKKDGGCCGIMDPVVVSANVYPVLHRDMNVEVGPDVKKEDIFKYDVKSTVTLKSRYGNTEVVCSAVKFSDDLVTPKEYNVMVEKILKFTNKVLNEHKEDTLTQSEFERMLKEYVYEEL